jgi:hypothetical protein
MERASGFGASMPESSQLCRGEDSSPYCCGAQTANDLDAFITRRPVNCVPLNLDPSESSFRPRVRGPRLTR